MRSSYIFAVGFWFAIMRRSVCASEMARTASGLPMRGRDAVEQLHLAGGERVAAGEDHAVILGQLHAALRDGVDAVRFFGARVEHEVALALLAIRQHAQQDQRADLRVPELRVVERLRRVVDGLAVDALAAGGVVLDLDGEIAARGLD